MTSTITYLLECSYFVDQQKTYLPKDLVRRPSAIGFGEIMNVKYLSTLFKLSKLCKRDFEYF